MNLTKQTAVALTVITAALMITACAGGASTSRRTDVDKRAALLAAVDTAVPVAFADINAALPVALPANATIAVFPVTAASADMGEVVLEGLTGQFINANYTVVEKRRVEELLAEYDFQKSGMVGEKTLGELLGADAVIFSTLSDDGNLHSWAVDTIKRTTLAKSKSISAISAQAAAQLTVEYPAVPSIRPYPDKPGDKVSIDTYKKEMLEPWVREITAIARAHPSAPLPPEPAHEVFAGSYYESGRGTVYFSDRDAESAAREAWQTAMGTMGERTLPPFLPEVTGGSNNEAETIASFLKYGNYTSNVSAATVQQIGRKNMLILGTSGVVGSSGTALRFVEYADALELWVKLQSPPPADRKTLAVVNNANIWSQYGAGVNRAEAETLTQIVIADTLSVRYENVILRSFVDATSAYEAGLTELPQTVRVEGVEITNPGRLALQWRQYIKTPQFPAGDYYDNREARYGMMALAEYTKTTIGQNYVYHFDWSRRGNRTRLDVGKTYMNPQANRRVYAQYSIEYGSQQEFLRKMRGLSLFILVKLASADSQIWGLNAYDLSTAVAPAPVPANFTQIKSVSSQQGAAPMGGFYIATTPVSQRDYEGIMKQNPSAVKNPNSPVNNVSVIDAMMYCNQISIRDGLEPAYLIEYEGAHRDWLWGVQEERITSVTLDRFASGYRLPATDEWKYALEQVSGMGVQGEYVFDGSFQGRIEGIRLDDRRSASYMTNPMRSNDVPLIPILQGNKEFDSRMTIASYEQDVGGGRFRVSPVIRVIRPVFDYWKYTSGQ